MGGWISVIASLIATILLYGTGHSYLFFFAVLITIACFWTFGIMHNYATSSAKSRHDRILENMKLEERSEEEITAFDNRFISPSTHDVNAIPDKLAFINMIISITGYVLLLVAIYLKYIR
ncbi:MAG: hypothetical protein ACE5H1_05435 [Thermodesulfobacteriota bacterium]